MREDWTPMEIEAEEQYIKEGMMFPVDPNLTPEVKWPQECIDWLWTFPEHPNCDGCPSALTCIKKIALWHPDLQTEIDKAATVDEVLAILERERAMMTEQDKPISKEELDALHTPEIINEIAEGIEAMARGEGRKMSKEELEAAIKDRPAWWTENGEINALRQETGWTGVPGDIPNCSFMEFCNRLGKLFVRELMKEFEKPCSKHSTSQSMDANYNWDKNYPARRFDCPYCMEQLRKKVGLDD